MDKARIKHIINNFVNDKPLNDLSDEYDEYLAQKSFDAICCGKDDERYFFELIKNMKENEIEKFLEEFPQYRKFYEV